MSERNVLGGPLEPCGTDPMTGFHRDGCCRPDPFGQSTHLICGVMTAEFLEHQVSIGNDLVTTRHEFDFPGLQPGDRWCVVAARWLQSYEAGIAAPVVLASTNERALEIIPIELLQEASIDVPPDASSLV